MYIIYIEINYRIIYSRLLKILIFFILTLLCFTTFVIVLNCYFPSKRKVYDSLEVVNLSILLQFTISTEEVFA